MPVSDEYVSLEMLRKQIEIARIRMQKLWHERGYTDSEVLRASIELDRLMNEYQRRAGFLRR
jgi:adenylosuccinate lyase